MEQINQLLNKAGLERKKIYEWNDLDDYFEVSAKEQVKRDLRNRQESEISDYDIERLTQQMFQADAKMVIGNAEKFCKTFDLLYKGESYPEWLLKSFRFKVRMDDVQEHITMEFKGMSDVIGKLFYAVDRNEPFINLISPEFRVKRIFQQEEALEELKEKYIEEISKIKGQFNGKKEVEAMAEELKRVVREDRIKRIKKYRVELKYYDEKTGQYT